MDPDACCDDIVNHIREGRCDDACDSMEHLANWLENGGFHPKMHNIYRVLISVCRMIIKEMK